MNQKSDRDVVDLGKRAYGPEGRKFFKVINN